MPELVKQLNEEKKTKNKNLVEVLPVRKTRQTVLLLESRAA